ncbi:hypothetical protein L6164_018284 [Bauhinia variegata]|uniref:Uncharacterized protein n=1 Tax=Bauhinia variegata TaxID=167791 RepID=A0ACB9NAI4_BAUVA|nr:hypothetical protein L6164_018284 [Bauhinia variegata]
MSTQYFDMKLRDVLSFSIFLLCLLLALCFQSFTFEATLQQDEVETLKDIAKTIGKKNWNFNVDPCSQEQSWLTPNTPKNAENAVQCDCNATLCHVVSMYFFAPMPTKVDWAKELLSSASNPSQRNTRESQLTLGDVVMDDGGTWDGGVLRSQSLPGTLPPELVRLPYLREIVLELNYLSGTIPPQWGSMKFLNNVSLLGNRLTGPIPPELGNIATLVCLNLEDNQFTGNLPPELGNLVQLQRMLLTSNTFTGGLPATFARLTALNDFRIGGNEFSGKIPNFIKSWTTLEKLVTQGSGLTGPIPDEISFLKNLTDLRISDLNGPNSPFPPLDSMTNLNILILRSCNITGTLPQYLGKMTQLRILDLSYNKLTGEIPNIFGGLRDVHQLLLTGNLLSGPVPEWPQEVKYIDLSYNNFSIEDVGTCLNEKMNSFQSSLMGNNSGTFSCLASIPCPETWYDLQINCGGNLVNVGGNKKYDDDSIEAGQARFNHLRRANWAVRNTGEFLDSDRANYFTTSTSGLAMANAELYMNARVSSDSITYYGFCMGNGKYAVNLHFAEIMFSADETYYSLGKRVFDIYIQGELVLKDFDIVKEAGGVRKVVIKKFTAFVTTNNLVIHLYWAGKGTTAIPFRSAYGPLISAISVDLEKGSGIPKGAVIAIVAAGVIVAILVFGLIWWRYCLGQKNLLAREIKIDLQTGLFTLRQIKEATNNFDIACKIGEGGFGPVYKGILSDGRRIAEDQMLLIYEYMENNNLAHALFGREEGRVQLDWPTRLQAEDNTHISTRIAGTYGYIAPEYAMHGYLTEKVDVYSFGVVALEIVSGRSNTTNQQVREECASLLDWSRFLKEKGSLMELVDPRLGADFNKEEVMVMINVALVCTHGSPTHRPTMSSVVSMLEGRTVVQEVKSDRKGVLEAMRRYYRQIESNEISETQSQSLSLSFSIEENATATATSTSAEDLYPVSLDSYEKRLLKDL